MGNGKQGKSWNYRSSLSRPGKCGSWEAMENRVICICKLRKQVKAAHNQETFQEKWPNLGYGKMWRVMIEVLEKSWNFQSSIGNTVRDYFKDTVTPSFD